MSGCTRIRWALWGVLAAAGALAVGTSAAAVQFTPDLDDRLNTFQSGDPGTPFNTPTDGVDYDGVGSGDPHPGEARVDGSIPTLNYFDGSAQQSVGFGNAIDISLEAELASASLVSAGGGDVQFFATFNGTSDGQPDLVLTDPTDSTVLLESNLVPGTLNGNPVDPVSVISAPFDPLNVPAQPSTQVFAFFQTQVEGNPWEVLFSDDVGTLNDSSIAQALLSNFNPSFDQIADELGSTGELPSLQAEANGTIFALSGSQFTVIPEPGTAGLLGGGLGMLWIARRRTASKG